jgi:hypothetical protein
VEKPQETRTSAIVGLSFLLGFWIGKVALQLTVISTLYFYIISRAFNLPSIALPKLLVVLGAIFVSKYAFVPPDVNKVNTNISVFLKEILLVLAVLCTIALLSKLI